MPETVSSSIQPHVDWTKASLTSLGAASYTAPSFNSILKASSAWDRTGLILFSATAVWSRSISTKVMVLTQCKGGIRSESGPRSLAAQIPTTKHTLTLKSSGYTPTTCHWLVKATKQEHKIEAKFRCNTIIFSIWIRISQWSSYFSRQKIKQNKIYSLKICSVRYCATSVPMRALSTRKAQALYTLDEVLGLLKSMPKISSTSARLGFYPVTSSFKSWQWCNFYCLIFLFQGPVQRFLLNFYSGKRHWNEWEFAYVWPLYIYRMTNKS